MGEIIAAVIILYLLGVAHGTYGTLLSPWYKRLLKRMFKEGYKQCER